MKRITIQGIAGCFHETAAHGSFPGEEVEVLPCVSFDEQFACMAADPELLGVAAIENTISAASSIAIHFFIVCSSILPGGCVAALFCYRGNTLPY